MRIDTSQALYMRRIKEKWLCGKRTLRTAPPYLHRFFLAVRYKYARRVRREKSVKERKQWKKEKALDPISDS